MSVIQAHKGATAHYGDPCLHCETPMAEVAAGPCPARAENKPGQRVEFRMSEADFGEMIKAITRARLTPVIAIQCGMPRSPQEVANDEWCALGKRLGFDGMSVEPSGKGPRIFTAIATRAQASQGARTAARGRLCQRRNRVERPRHCRRL